MTSPLVPSALIRQLHTLPTFLLSNIIGQDEVLQDICGLLRRSFCELRFPQRPIASMLEVRLNLETDRAMRTMDPVEWQFFATCLRGVYTPPEQRGEEWQSEQEKAKELREIGAVPQAMR